MSSVWLYFYRIFITDQQVGILDGMAFAIGLIAEVPSGALADRIGRDKMVKLGHLLSGFGLFIQAVGSSFVPFFVGQAILMIGVSFVSGADEALFFERLNFSDSTLWRKLVTKSSQISLIGSLIATLSGGWLHSVNPRIPWFLTGLAFIFAAVSVWSVTETRALIGKRKFVHELQENLHGIVSGFAQFLQPKLFLYVPIIVIVQGLFYAAGWGLLRMVLLDRFGFSPFQGAVAIASSSLITVGLLSWMHKHAERLSEKHVLTVITLSAAASLLFSVFDLGWWGYSVILALYVGEHVLYPFMSEILNTRVSEDQRATMLSVASFLRTLPYVALAPLIGYLNTINSLHYFLIGWALLMCGVVILYLFRKKLDTKVSLVE